VTHMTEEYPTLYTGAVVCGAALLVVGDPPEEPLDWSYKPGIPLLFVTNYCDGVGNILNYCEMAKKERESNESIVVPVSWTVERPGHCQVNMDEMLHATNALLFWMDGGTLEESMDITEHIPPHLSTTIWSFDESNPQMIVGGLGHVISVDEYSSVVLSFTPEDFKRLGIQEGKQPFVIKLKDQEVTAIQDSYPFIAARESDATYLVFSDAEGFITVEKNSLATATCPELTLLRLKRGDSVHVKAVVQQRPGRLRVPQLLRL